MSRTLPPLARLARAFSTCRAASQLRVAFFGTDEVSLATLVKLHESYQGKGCHAGLVSALDVVCPGDRPAGRGQKITPVPVSVFAKQHGLNAIHVPYTRKSLKSWEGAASLAKDSPLPRPFSHDVGVVVSFGYFMPPTLLDMMRLGAVNMHPSLLPRYRGPAPIPHTLLSGDGVTGVSIIELHRGAFDAGALLDQLETPVHPHEGCAALTARLAALGAERVMHVLSDVPAARASARPQAEAHATHAPKLTPAHGLVAWGDPAQCTVEGLLRRCRAFDDSFGLASHFTFGTPEGVPKRVRLLLLAPPHPAAVDAVERHALLLSAQQAQAAAAASHPVNGRLAYHKPTRSLLVRASDGWLAVGRLHVEARPAPVEGADFANGYRLGLGPGADGRWRALA